MSGGHRATNRALLYTKDQIKPNSQEIGAVGEGIAGYYLENIENLSFEIRPFDTAPDLIFRDSTGGRILAEVKTRLDNFPRDTKFVTTLISQIDVLTKTDLIRTGEYIAYVIGVAILGPDEFELRRLKMEEI